MTSLDAAARSYLGVPFLHQGRNPAIGIDCIGLLVLSAKDCGLHHLASRDLTDYSINPIEGQLELHLRSALGPPSDEIHAGWIASFDFKGQTRHVGIISLMEDGRFGLIHTYNSPAKVIEHGLDNKWIRRITGIYKVEAAE